MEIQSVKRLMKERGRTQRELAAYLGVDPAAITRLFAGKRRLRLDEAPRVAAFLGMPPPNFGGELNGGGGGAIASNVEMRATRGDGDPDAGARDLPVYGSAQGGSDGMTIDYEPIEWMRRPQALEGVVDAFAFYVVGDSMSPRFRHGERLLVHPRRPPRAGEDVLVILKDSEDCAAEPTAKRDAIVKTLVARTAAGVTLGQYNPHREFDVPAERIDSLLLIVGSYFYG